MRFDVFTLFPDLFPPYLNESILKRAQEMGALNVNLHNIRDYALDKHRMTDDMPYGGGGGMGLKPEPLCNALEVTLGSPPPCPVILFTPQGRVFDQAIARELAQQPQLALICGRYEGVDQRAVDALVTDELSLGDFVLTGGELPALLVIDALTRLLPGVLGDPTATDDDSHSASKLLEYPHYTRPAQFRGQGIPATLLSGNHAAIERWRRQQAMRRTLRRRPDLFVQAQLSLKDWELLLQDG